MNHSSNSSSTSEEDVKVEETYLCIIDFEATCSSKNTLFPQEIIEFPAILYNATTLQVIAEFHSYKPQYHPTLTPYCKQLTGIKQQDIDNAPTLDQVLIQFSQWLILHEMEDDDFAIVTCGNWDLKTMLPNECHLKNLFVPHCFDSWINLKKIFCDCYNVRKEPTMMKMLDFLALDLRGRHHSGIDDARNIVRIVEVMVRNGFIEMFQYTGWLK